ARRAQPDDDRAADRGNPRTDHLRVLDRNRVSAARPGLAAVSVALLLAGDDPAEHALSAVGGEQLLQLPARVLRGLDQRRLVVVDRVLRAQQLLVVLAEAFGAALRH